MWLIICKIFFNITSITATRVSSVSYVIINHTLLHKQSNFRDPLMAFLCQPFLCSPLTKVPIPQNPGFMSFIFLNPPFHLLPLFLKFSSQFLSYFTFPDLRYKTGLSHNNLHLAPNCLIEGSLYIEAAGFPSLILKIWVSFINVPWYFIWWLFNKKRLFV